MSYLAIARKYRPATFDEIVGQEHVTRTLKNALRKGRIHHAFLFSGARGVGKTTAARALARSLNCQKGPTAEPCGACTSCVEITAGNSPDLIEIDGASNNSVDDIRDLRETVRYAPTRGKWKIYLIDEVHMLSKGAFNALLKTLEEPPPHVVFLFATTESNRLPETILSRCQRFEFKRIPATAVAERLGNIARGEGARISEASLRLIARAGEGSMRDAESLLDQVISYATSEDGAVSDQEVVEALGLIDRGLLYDMLEGLVSGRPDRCLAIVEKVYGSGYELAQFTGEMLEVLRNATFARLSPEARQYIDVAPEELERMLQITEGVDPEALSRAFAALLDVHDQVSKASRPRIVLEMAVARLATTRPVQPVGALLGRLEDLERRLRQGGATAPIGGLRGARSPRPPRARQEPSSDDDGAPPARVAAPAHPNAPQPDRHPNAPDPEPTRPEPTRPVARRPDPIPAPASSREPDPRDAARRPDPRSGERAGSGDRRWDAVRAAALDLGPPFALLAEGEPSFRHGRLRVLLRPRSLAELRKVAGDPRVAAAVARGYPEGTPLELVGPSDREALRAEDLVREVKQDPAFKRIIDRLGAEVGKVTPLDDDPEA